MRTARRRRMDGSILGGDVSDLSIGVSESELTHIMARDFSLCVAGALGSARKNSLPAGAMLMTLERGELMLRFSMGGRKLEVR